MVTKREPKKSKLTNKTGKKTKKFCGALSKCRKSRKKTIKLNNINTILELT